MTEPDDLAGLITAMGKREPVRGVISGCGARWALRPMLPEVQGTTQDRTTEDTDTTPHDPKESGNDRRCAL